MFSSECKVVFEEEGTAGDVTMVFVWTTETDLTVVERVETMGRRLYVRVEVLGRVCRHWRSIQRKDGGGMRRDAFSEFEG